MDSLRWNNFLKSQQLLMIGSELIRAEVWQNRDNDKFKSALERGFELIDLCLADPRWKDNTYALLFLREELGKFYVGERNDSIEALYRAL